MLPRIGVDDSGIGLDSTLRSCSAAPRDGFGSRSVLAGASISRFRPNDIPRIGFIGCEVFENGIAKLLARDRAAASRQYPDLCR